MPTKQYYSQCCSCHANAIQQDGILPGRSNRQQSPSGPVNMRRNMRLGWKLGLFIKDPLNHSPARNKTTTTALSIVPMTQYFSDK